jgi:hypothetical protein
MSGFLDQWNMFTGVPVGAHKRDPRKSERDISYAGPLEEWPVLWSETPEHQALATDCPSCGETLHYSSGWERRTCMLCGYIEGMGGHHVYPRAVSESDWLFTIGLLYQQMVSGDLTQDEFREEMRQITFVGSVYRPCGEDP